MNNIFGFVSLTFNPLCADPFFQTFEQDVAYVGYSKRCALTCVEEGGGGDYVLKMVLVFEACS